MNTVHIHESAMGAESNLTQVEVKRTQFHDDIVLLQQIGVLTEDYIYEPAADFLQLGGEVYDKLALRLQELDDVESAPQFNAALELLWRHMLPISTSSTPLSLRHFFTREHDLPEFIFEEALLPSMRRYRGKEEGSDAHFTTFYAYRARGAAIDWSRSEYKLQTGRSGAGRNYRYLLGLNGDSELPDTFTELVAHLESLSEYGVQKDAAWAFWTQQKFPTVYLDKPVDRSNPNSSTVGEFLADTSVDVEATALDPQYIIQIVRAANLNEKELTVIALLYGLEYLLEDSYAQILTEQQGHREHNSDDPALSDGYTDRAIPMHLVGSYLGVTVSRVSQLHKAALEKLTRIAKRQERDSKSLRDYLK